MAQTFDSDIEAVFAQVAADPAVARALALVHTNEKETLEIQKELALIEAPTFHEENKSRRYGELLGELGLEDITTDKLGSVYGWIRGEGHTGKCIILEGHLDTVFSFGDVKGVTVDDEGLVHCPGICDDTRALAANLSVLRAIKECGLKPWHDILIAGTVREEGLGGMGGMAQLLADHGKEVLASVSIDGAGIDVFYANATGMVDYDATYTGPGGHAWTKFGVPSAVQAACRAAALVSEIGVPATPKTSFTVSLIEGGQAIHGIAQRCSLKVNARSNSPEALARLKEQLLSAFRQGADDENRRWNTPGVIEVAVSTILDVPAGSQDESCRMIQAAKVATRAVGVEPRLLPGGCTNGNMAICAGIPAVTFGRGGREYGQHTLDEWFDPQGVWRCEQKSILMVMALAGLSGVTEPLADTL